MDIKKILELHKMWLNNEEGGKRADLCWADLRDAKLCDADLRYAKLCGANLCGADLRDADLRGANLCRADLRDADLCGADLRDADLRGANLYWADLRDADLCGADLRDADLRGANLYWADLRDAKLCDADLRYADLRGANLRGANTENVKYNESTAFFALQCPEGGPYIGYKKSGGLIVKLEITSDALRSSATTRKCRASKAKVLDITNIEGDIHYSSVESNYDSKFVYVVGETVCVEDFDTDRWNECSTGIHHFITRQEAVNY